MKKRRSGKERRGLLAEFRRSGLSRPEFCRKHAIHYTTLCGWLRAVGVEKPGGGFRRLKVSPLSGLGEPVVAEIALGNGVRVRVMRGGNSEELGMILEAARSCGS